jgi:hypothetical protein
VVVWCRLVRCGRCVCVRAAALKIINNKWSSKSPLAFLLLFITVIFTNITVVATKPNAQILSKHLSKLFIIIIILLPRFLTHSLISVDTEKRTINT